MKHKNHINLLFFSILYLASSISTANIRQIGCKVVGITDGDTLTCLKDRTPLKVRLLNIDAPESAQPFGNRAKQTLARLAFKKNVRLHISGYDKYQRLLGVVFDESNRNINLKLVELGMAWAYWKSEPIYRQAQQKAQTLKIGLWQDKHPINPYDWRKNKRSVPAQTMQNLPAIPPLTTQVNCAVKLSCAKMEKQGLSYAHALRYFQQCGWKELDGNHDGIPCNRLYRKAQRQ